MKIMLLLYVIIACLGTGLIGYVVFRFLPAPIRKKLENFHELEE